MVENLQLFQNSKVKERKTNMKVRFAHNGAVIGTLGTTGTITAEDAGAKIDPSTEQLVGNQFFGKYGNWIKFGLDALDVGTDFLAQDAWEKQAKEKVQQMRDVKDAIGYSKSIREAAAQQASIYDKGGIGALAYAGVKGLQGIGMYQPKDPNYVGFIKSIGKDFGTSTQLPTSSNGSTSDIYYLQNTGVPSGGVPKPEVTNKTGGTATTASANQVSAKPCVGRIGAGKHGIKLIRRFN